MKQTEPRSFSSSFFFFSFFSFLFFLFAPQNRWQHNALTPPIPKLECLPVLKQWSDDNLMECTKLISILWTQLWNSMGHLLIKDWSQQRRKSPRPAGLGVLAGRPTACRLPLLRIFLLQTLWCFTSLCFTEFCSWFHCFAVEIIIYTQYIGCSQWGVSQKDIFG